MAQARRGPTSPGERSSRRHWQIVLGNDQGSAVSPPDVGATEGETSTAHRLAGDTSANVHGGDRSPPTGPQLHSQDISRAPCTKEPVGEYTLQDGNTGVIPLPANTTHAPKHGASPEVVIKPETKPSGRNRPEDWESRKAEIRELYLGNEMTLKQVREAMAERGFEASARMYKDKFAKWGFNKNNRKKDAARMLQLERKRGVVGKGTVFYRNGRPVDMASYLHRAKLSKEDLQQLDVDTELLEELPQTLRALTPTDDIPAVLHDPDVHAIHGMLLRCFGNLLARARDYDLDQNNKEWVSWTKSDFYKAIRDLRQRPWFVSAGYKRESDLVVERALPYLYGMIENPNPALLFDLIMCQLSLDHKFKPEERIWQSLANHAFAKRVPWFHALFRSLDHYLEENTAEKANGLLSLVVADLCHLVVPITEQTLPLALQGNISNYTRISSPMKYGFTSTLPVCMQISKMSIRLAYEILDPRNELVRMHNMTLRGCQSEWQDESLFPELVDLHRSHMSINNRRICLRAMAYFHRTQALKSPTADTLRNNLARHYLKEALELCETADHPFASGAVEREIWEDARLLEVWSREDGDFSVAESLSQYKQERLERYFASLGLRDSPKEGSG